MRLKKKLPSQKNKKRKKGLSPDKPIYNTKTL